MPQVGIKKEVGGFKRMNITDKFDFFLFDWDGCLADTTQSWVSAYFTALKNRGRKISFSELREKAWGNHEQGPKNLGIADYQNCWNEVISLAEKGLNNPPLHKHVRFLLRQLKKKNNKIGLVTSSYKNVITTAMNNHKIDHFFWEECWG